MLTARLLHSRVVELEVYAAGIREIDKVLALDRELALISGLRYKIDTNHDIVYFDFDEPTVTFPEIRALFHKLNLEPRFVGAIPPELRPRSKTELLTT